MPPKKQQVIESQGAVDPQVLQAIKIAIQPVVDSQTSMSRKIDEAMGQLTTLSGKVEDLESAAQAVDNRMETVVKEALPSITTHIESISSALAMHHLELGTSSQVGADNPWPRRIRQRGRRRHPGSLFGYGKKLPSCAQCRSNPGQCLPQTRSKRKLRHHPPVHRLVGEEPMAPRCPKPERKGHQDCPRPPSHTAPT